MKKNYIQPSVEVVTLQTNTYLLDTSVNGISSTEAGKGSESETVNYGNEGSSVWDD